MNCLFRYIRIHCRIIQGKTLLKPAERNKIRVILFDLDGTLVDTELLYLEATERALKDAGCSLEQKQLLDIVYGKSQGDIVSCLTGLFPGKSLGNLENGIRHHYSIISRDKDIRIPSSIALLKQLSKNYPIGIVSGSPRIAVEEKIEALDIQSSIGFTLCSEDYHPGKPDPACYLLSAGRLGLPPSLCLVFEDSNAGVRAAKAAGMYCVALERPGTQKQDLSLADLVLSDLADFALSDFVTADFPPR
jgi:beta-phosphoglucomutase-like phosphatase (HAD superfamily)